MTTAGIASLFCHVPLAFFGGIGPMEMVIIGIVGVLLFGKRLPEVGKSLGKGLMEFKKGVKGIEDEVYSATNPVPVRSQPRPASTYNDIDDRDEATAPKFEPPSAEPQAAVSKDVQDAVSQDAVSQNAVSQNAVSQDAASQEVGPLPVAAPQDQPM